ncbi:MAG: YggT family protein [Candidatus Eisenbacteria bacterium]|nr:YggT family protein [Candidatus Eisenbacteria bacterium]
MLLLNTISSLFHMFLLYGTLALILLILFRIFVPPARFRYGTGSVLYRIGRITDFLVSPIYSLMPPGTHAAVPAILAIFAVILIGYFAGNVFDDVAIRGIGGFMVSLGAGRPMAAIGFLLYGFVSLYVIILVIRILFSWIRVGYLGAGRFTRFVYEITEPALALFRSVLPPIGGFDLSPILLFFLLQFVKQGIWMIFIRG